MSPPGGWLLVCAHWLSQVSASLTSLILQFEPREVPAGRRQERKRQRLYQGKKASPEPASPQLGPRELRVPAGRQFLPQEQRVVEERRRDEECRERWKQVGDGGRKGNLGSN